jgi:hypothetical protein
MHVQLDTGGANRVSFPDCLIASFAADDRQIIFRSDGVFVDGVGFIGPDADVRCSISGAVGLREYADGQWHDRVPSQSAGLREIGEWSAAEGQLTLAGFGAASGLWAEFSVARFSLSLTASRI